jgi:hypothetical protein
MIVNRAMTSLLPLVAALALVGCWTAPSADVRPTGPPRLIQKGIVVRSVVRRAVVQSVDPDTRMIVLQVRGTTGTQVYRAGANVSDLDHLTPGATVVARVAEELTVYVSPDGRLPGDDSTTPTGTHWKVLSVDPSYRLLTLQDPDGRTQTFKVGLEVELKQMQSGDAVMIQTPREIVSLSVRKRWLER